MRIFITGLTAINILVLSSFAFAEDTTATRMVVADRLVSETVTDSFVENITNSLWPPLEASLKEKNPSIDAELLEGLKEDLADQQRGLIEKLVVDMPAIYAKFFTTDELEAILAVQTSDVGKKAMQVQPQIMAEMMPILLRSIEERTPIIVENFRKRAEEKGFKL